MSLPRIACREVAIVLVNPGVLLASPLPLISIVERNGVMERGRGCAPLILTVERTGAEARGLGVCAAHLNRWRSAKRLRHRGGG